MLIERIKADQMTARKAKDEIARSLLTTLLGEVQTIAKNAGRDLPTDEEVTAVVRKFQKGNNEVLSYDLDELSRAFAEREAIILAGYLPQQLSLMELTALVAAYVNEGKNNVGMIMAALKADHAGKYDGKMASSVIKAALV